MSDASVCRPGIYQIRNKANGKVYVGSSHNIQKRWAGHRYSLNKGSHHCKKLQNAWVSYGEDAFLFEVLEAVSEVSSLFQREQHWINSLNAYYAKGGYNAYPIAGGPSGSKWTAEQRAKLSALRLGKKTGKRSAKVRAYMWQRNQCPKRRKAISDALKNRIITPEHAAAIRAAKFKRWYGVIEDDRQSVLAL